jgi:hypothetical protein
LKPQRARGIDAITFASPTYSFINLNSPRKIDLGDLSVELSRSFQSIPRASTMQKYTHPFVPGPTMVPSEISSIYTIDFPSSDVEDEFFSLYDATKLKRFLNCSGDISIQSGEAMVVLWGAMKSVLNKGDKVLAIGTGTIYAQSKEKLFCFIIIYDFLQCPRVVMLVWKLWPRCHVAVSRRPMYSALDTYFSCV